MNDLKNIQKLAKMLDGKQLLSHEDIAQLIADMVNSFAQHRSAFKELSAQSEETLNTSLKNLQSEFDRMRSDMDGGMIMTKSEMKQIMEKAMGDVKKAVKEIEAMKPLNGADADEEKIVEEVLAKIKLPENKVVTPEETRDMLESLEGEDRLDASAIKNLPELKQQIIQDVRRGVSQRVVAGSNITITTDGNGQQVINATGGSGSGDVSKVGTPVNNQVGVWTGDGTIEGDADLTFDTSTNTLSVAPIGLDGRVVVHAVKSDASDGLLIEANNGTDVGVLGVGNTANVTWYGSHIFGGLINANAGVQLAENTSIALDPAGSADGKYTGTTVTGTGGAVIAFGDLVCLSQVDSRWELVDISVAAAAVGDARKIIGMAVTSSTDGGALTVLLNGIIRADANFPALTIGNPVYASTAGDITVTQPSTTDHIIRVVGFALTADEIYFNPSNDYITHV